MQNRALSGRFTPQAVQDATRLLPHDMQNAAASGFDVPHTLHFVSPAIRL